MTDDAEERKITVGRKKKKNVVQDSLIESLHKTDDMLEVIMDRISKGNNTVEKSEISAGGKYGDLNCRIEAFLDSLPNHTRYRAIGAIHSSLNEIEDRFSLTNPAPLQSVSHPQQVLPPPHIYPQYYFPPPAPNFYAQPHPHNFNVPGNNPAPDTHSVISTARNLID